MTRGEALVIVHRLALDLGPTAAGIARLLERIAGHDEAETLRDALTELGAQAVLDTQGQEGANHAKGA